MRLLPGMLRMIDADDDLRKHADSLEGHGPGTDENSRTKSVLLPVDMLLGPLGRVARAYEEDKGVLHGCRTYCAQVLHAYWHYWEQASTDHRGAHCQRRHLPVGAYPAVVSCWSLTGMHCVPGAS